MGHSNFFEEDIFSDEAIQDNIKVKFTIVADQSYVYVDDDFNQTTPGWGYDHFDEIQHGIDAVNYHGTVYVYDGVYYENIIVNKTINLVGEIKEETIIDGINNNSVVHVLSDKTTLQNFTIKNSGGYAPDAGLRLDSENNSIKNCLIYRTRTGIFLDKADYNIIENCTFHSNGEGILIASSYSIIVEGCCFSHNSIGCHFQASKNCWVGDCYLHTNGIACLFDRSSNIEVLHCDISNNSVNTGGAFFVKCSNVTINNSIFRHNGAGINIFESDMISITYCDFYLNTHFAISMRTASEKVLISHSEIRHNFRYGIYIEKNNRCKITNNNIINNTLFGIRSKFAHCIARYNWWGSPLGPSYTSLRTSSKITLFTGGIRFFPWLLKPLEDIGVNWKSNYTCMNETHNSNENIIDLPGNDTDDDGVPDWWEEKWGYDPNSWDDHKNLDPDKDALNNFEECYTDEYGSNPFRRDIFLEVDWMESLNPYISNKPPENLIEKVISIFDKQNISLHVDLGNLDGGEEIPYCTSTLSFANIRDLYWEYFLYNDINNPRKGIFHYGVICKYCPDLNFPFFGWDQLDSFAISAKWLKEEIPLVGLGRLIVGAIVHHLGHSLGLLADTHGGIDNLGTQIPFTMEWWKYRNYKSCMNYYYKYKIFDYSDGTHGWGDFNDWEHLNFSFFKNSHFT